MTETSEGKLTAQTANSEGQAFKLAGEITREHATRVRIKSVAVEGRKTPILVVCPPKTDVKDALDEETLAKAEKPVVEYLVVSGEYERSKPSVAKAKSGKQKGAEESDS